MGGEVGVDDGAGSVAGSRSTRRGGAGWLTGRVDHEEIARVGSVDCGLDAGGRGHVGWRFAAYSDGDGVNG